MNNYTFRQMAGIVLNSTLAMSKNLLSRIPFLLFISRAPNAAASEFSSRLKYFNLLHSLYEEQRFRTAVWKINPA